MGVSELSAFDAAYAVLQPLDEAGRRRALQWLSDALGQPKALRRDEAAAEPVIVEMPAVNGRRNAGAARNGRAVKTVAAAPKTRGRGRGKAQVQDRPYRRMPEPAEVMAAYRKVGSISGLAEVFDVPVYTVHAWARRLRHQGHHIGRS